MLEFFYTPSRFSKFQETGEPFHPWINKTANAIRGLDGGEYLDARCWSAFKKSQKMGNSDLARVLHRKFLLRATYRNLRHRDLVYLDLSNCDLSRVSASKLLAVLEDVHCQESVYGMPKGEIEAKVPKCCVAALGVSCVTFNYNSQRTRFLKQLEALFLNPNFYSLDLCGWSSSFVKGCFSRGAWIMKSKCVFQ